MRSLLLVDDDSLVRDMFSLALEHAGYRVTAAANGIQGVRLASETMFDGVIMDVNMPHVGGIETCQRMISENKTGLPPIVLLMTGLWTPEVEQEGLAAGARAVLAKPFSCDFLIRQLEAGWAENGSGEKPESTALNPNP